MYFNLYLYLYLLLQPLSLGQTYAFRLLTDRRCRNVLDITS